MKTTDLHKTIQKYFSVFMPHEKNASPRTICSYRDSFVSLFVYFRDELNLTIDKLTLADITRDRVRVYLNWLVEEQHCALSTRNHRLCAIRAFAKYLQYENIDRLEKWQRILSIPMVKYETPHMNYLTNDGVKILLEQPDMRTRAGRRHLAILALLCDTGARVQELADLKVSNLRIDIEPFTVTILGKGRKMRTVPLIPEQVLVLKQYMKEWNLFNKLETPLFFNSRGEKLTRAGISYIVGRYAEMAHDKNPSLVPLPFSCHCLRHTKAMTLLKSGADLHEIKDILGHASIQTTEIYARADSKMKRDALEKAYMKTHPDLESGNLWHDDANLMDWLNSLG